MSARLDPRAVLRFAIEQCDWELADLIAARLMAPLPTTNAVAERATATLIEALGLGDAHYDPS